MYLKWAPRGCKWVEWVRPVPFVAIEKNGMPIEYVEFQIPEVTFLKKLPTDTAIFVDLSGDSSIEEGIALAKFGFRPIPIYNGTNEQEGSIGVVNNHEIEDSLLWGAMELEKITLAKDAPPAFLLDRDRTNMYKMDESVFDNSWDIYDQDIPSPEYFLENGISKVIVIGEYIQRDLRAILYKFQQKGIEIFEVDEYDDIQKAVLKKALRGYKLKISDSVHK